MATQTSKQNSVGFSAEERAAMKNHAAELKAAARRAKSANAAAEAEAEVLAKIAEMTGTDREIAERLHALIKSVAPELTCKTWYGMPSYMRDGKILCFFQAAGKFKTRYATFGFNDIANLDDGDAWPTHFALQAMTPKVEAKITETLRKALS
ncbi:DUF1801 domain-containing protein [Nocardia sp. JMUB6875]|uniref:iron chaperone n=1 Tax=Nocardia sp. JMUB6875 TaxID=3158170 RepID=UPI0032E6B827